MNNFYLTVLIVSAVLASCGPQGQKVQHEGQPTNQEQETLTETAAPKNLKFNLGQDIKLGDFVVKVNKVADHKSTNQFMEPEKGNKLVAIEVEYYNPTQDKQFDANPMQWKLFDNEYYSYDHGIMVDSKTPKLHVTTVNPGSKVKGWVTFEIPESSKALKVQFQPEFFDNANIEISLELQ